MPKQPRRVDGWLLDRHTLAPLRSHWIKHHGNPALDGLRKGKLHAQSWDEVVDFLVVGSGGGSMCAGLAVKALGKSPYILEKTDRIGGSTAMSGGVLWVPNHPLQAREGVPDSDEAARTYLNAVVGNDGGPGSTPQRRTAFLRYAPKMIEFLES